MKLYALASLLGVCLACSSPAQAQRDTISIVGSSAVYPFTIEVATRFSGNTDFRMPKVESTGTRGGIQLFCAGLGMQFPDAVNASRAINQSEYEACVGTGVEDIIEVRVGYQALVIANSAQTMALQMATRDIFLALAAEIPNPDGTTTTVVSPHSNWQDVNPALPATRIEVLVPIFGPRLRDTFLELAMEKGCRQFDWLSALAATDWRHFRAICHGIRNDGAFLNLEGVESADMIIRRLEASPSALSLLAYSSYAPNQDRLQSVLIDGSLPSPSTFADGSYPLSRPLFVYLKKAHIGVIPGLNELFSEYVSEAAMGEEGYLRARGLILLPEDQYHAVREAVIELTPIRPAPEAPLSAEPVNI